jgi:hypothetical protein
MIANVIMTARRILQMPAFFRGSLRKVVNNPRIHRACFGLAATAVAATAGYTYVADDLKDHLSITANCIEAPRMKVLPKDITEIMAVKDDEFQRLIENDLQTAMVRYWYKMDTEFVKQHKEKIDDTIKNLTTELCDGKYMNTAEFHMGGNDIYNDCTLVHLATIGFLDMEVIKEYKKNNTLPEYINAYFGENLVTQFSFQQDPNYWIQNRFTLYHYVPYRFESLTTNENK